MEVDRPYNKWLVRAWDGLVSSAIVSLSMPRAATPVPRAATPVTRSVSPVPRAASPVPRAASPVTRAAANTPETCVIQQPAQTEQPCADDKAPSPTPARVRPAPTATRPPQSISVQVGQFLAWRMQQGEAECTRDTAATLLHRMLGRISMQHLTPLLMDALPSACDAKEVAHVLCVKHVTC